MSLFDTVVAKCKQHGIRVLLSPTPEVFYPGTDHEYLGYFVVDPGGQTAVLCCAMLNPSWEEVLLHEFNHALQWIERSPHWFAPRLSEDEQARYGMLADQEALDVVHRWLDHELELAPEELLGLVNRSIQVELDCEKRTGLMGLELWEDWRHGYREQYVKKCNSYLRAYRYAAETRRWPVNRECEAVMAVMPTEFMTLDYMGPLSELEKQAFDASFEEGDE